MADEMAEERGSKPTLGKALAFVLAGVLFAVLLLEILLRIALCHIYFYAIPDKTLGRIYVPGAKGWFVNLDTGEKVPVRINNLGVRGKDVALSGSGRDRVIVLGDSFVEALQIPEERRFTELAEQKLGEANGPEIIALAMSRCGQGQELVYLDRLGRLLRPRIVIVCFYEGNDVYDNSPDLSDTARRSGWVLQDGRLKRIPPPYGVLEFAARHLVSVRFVYSQLRATTGAREVPEGFEGLLGTTEWLGVYRKNYDERWESAWEMTDALFAQLAETAKSQDARLAVIDIPPKYALDPPQVLGKLIKDLSRYDFRKPSALLREIGSKHGFPVVYAGETLLEHGGVACYGTKDAHLNQKGHEVMADLLVSLVRQLQEGGSR